MSPRYGGNREAGIRLVNAAFPVLILILTMLASMPDFDRKIIRAGNNAVASLAALSTSPLL